MTLRAGSSAVSKRRDCCHSFSAPAVLPSRRPLTHSRYESSAVIDDLRARGGLARRAACAGTRAARPGRPGWSPRASRSRRRRRRSAAHRRAAGARCRSTRCPPSRPRRRGRCGSATARWRRRGWSARRRATRSGWPRRAAGRCTRRRPTRGERTRPLSHTVFPALLTRTRYARCSTSRSRDSITHEKRGRSRSIPTGSTLRSTRRSSTPTRSWARADAALDSVAAATATTNSNRRMAPDMCILSPCDRHYTTNDQYRSKVTTDFSSAHATRRG